MKKITYLLMFLAVVMLATSCNKSDDSDDNDGITNKLTIDGMDYQLTQGFAYDYGEYDVQYNIDLTFLTSGIDAENQSGDGVGIYFELFSSTAEVIETGTYDLSDSSFDYGDVFFITDGDFDSYSEFVSGTVTITKSEKAYYELTFSGVDQDDRTISGSFSGSVVYESVVD